MNKKAKTLWIRIEKPEEVKDMHDFMLHVLAEEGLTGEIPVKLYVKSTKETAQLSHTYDMSEDALFSLEEKYGERNVKLTAAGLMPESWSCGSSADPLERIADALDRINVKLEDINTALGFIGDLM